MTIAVNEKSYVLALWMVAASPKHQNDFLMCIYKEENIPEAKWLIRYRWRYYDSDSTDPEKMDKDEKSWHYLEAVCDTPEENLLEQGRVIAGMCALRNESDVDEILVRGSGLKLTEAMKTKEWAHMQEKKVN